jgi:hypothetical protein
MCWDTHEIDAPQFVKIVETQVRSRRLRYWATITGFALVPITKVPCAPRETTISCDRWLVVVTVFVWCPLRICVISNRLCFGARYESSLWPQRNSNFTWPVASCRNGRCLMPVMNMSYQVRASTRYLSWLICNTWSVTDALPVTKGNLCPLPKAIYARYQSEFFT